MGQRANSPATGGPGITGTVQAGETLTATTDGIEDEDGLTGAVFAYQWVRSGADIEGAASSNYTVTGADEGKPIQVRVTFTDDAGNAESLTSYAKLSAPPLIIPDEEPPPESTATREAQGEQESAETPLTAAIHDAPESHDGQEDFTFELRFSEEPKEGFSDVTLRDHAFTVKGGTVVGARKLDGDSATPNTRWEISVSPDSNADVTVELSATEDCDAQGAICTDDDTMLSSPLEFTVKGPPLTASFESVPTSHNGSGEFRFRIAFSEEFSLSYKTLRDDHVFTVEGGKVTGARRLVKGSNIGWEIVVEPDSNGDVTITAARNHGLQRAGRDLHRGRQAAVQPLGAHRQRAGRIGRGRKSGRAACMAGQGRPSRQSAPEQAERQAWRVLVMVLKAKLEAVEAGITTITGFQEQDMPTNKGPEKQIGKDDVAAGAAGAAAGAGLGAALGGLGGAGLAIGGGAIAIPAVAVVAVPAVAVGAVAFGAWKVAKAFRKKSR